MSSLKTVVIHGATGPCHAAALHLVTEWVKSEGLPNFFLVTVPQGDRLILTTESRLSIYLKNELDALGARLNRQSLDRFDWPGGGVRPSSCRVEEI